MIEVRIKEGVVSPLSVDWFKLPPSYRLGQQRFLFKNYDFRIAGKIYQQSSEEFIKMFNKYIVWNKLSD